MHWKEIEPDIKLSEFKDAFINIDFLSALNAIVNLINGIHIYSLNSCLKEVLSHVSSNKKEIGGLLMGRVFSGNISGHAHLNTLTVITHILPSNEYKNSSVSLKMDSEIWSRTNKYFKDGYIVVGWYHSHPNLGAYFSATDRSTQRAFFNHYYSVGWVIDPFRNEQKVFLGENSEEYNHNIVGIDYGLEMAKNN